jgi:hypothetical protein
MAQKSPPFTNFQRLKLQNIKESMESQEVDPAVEGNGKGKDTRS